MSFESCTSNLELQRTRKVNRRLVGDSVFVRLRNVIWIVTLISVGLIECPATCAQEASGEIRATGCFLRLKDQASVPALEQGVLSAIRVQLGDRVTESQLLATLEETEARLSLQLAEIDLAIAVKKESESVAIEIAEAQVDESAQLIEQAKIDLSVARKMAASEIAIRQTTAANALAKEEYDRALTSRKEFTTSVSDVELSRLRYGFEKSTMDIEQARYDQSLQSLRGNSRSAFLEQQQVAARRLGFELREARSGQGISSLTVERMTTSVEVAKEKLNRRQLRSPLTGIVVEKLRDQGEWVEVGEPVLRVIRIDRLLVEGYVDADLVDQSSRGRSVRVTGSSRQGSITVAGRIMFVSPEIDSVNRQVQIKAEIDNKDFALRPGQPVDMIIHGETR